jgi:hypothetical protein
MALLARVFVWGPFVNVDWRLIPQAFWNSGYNEDEETFSWRYGVSWLWMKIGINIYEHDKKKPVGFKEE